jgi:hypothetical protein
LLTQKGESRPAKRARQRKKRLRDKTVSTLLLYYADWLVEKAIRDGLLQGHQRRHAVVGRGRTRHLITGLMMRKPFEGPIDRRHHNFYVVKQEYTADHYTGCQEESRVNWQEFNDQAG